MVRLVIGINSFLLSGRVSGNAISILPCCREHDDPALRHADVRPRGAADSGGAFSMSKRPSQPIVYSTYMGGQGMTWDASGYLTGIQGTHAAADFPVSHLGRRPVALVQPTFEFLLCGSEIPAHSLPPPSPAHS